MTRTRREHDSLGVVEVPENRLWGAQTQRSLENFPIGRRRFVWGRPVIRAFGVLKKAAARANGKLGQLPDATVEPIFRAADEVAAGLHDGEFPLGVFQTGSGTQSNMNANEVIARRASQLATPLPAGGGAIHPNDDVNRSQSSNDAFPAVMHIAAVETIAGHLLPAVAALREALAERGRALGALVIVGRTHLMDATPLTLGQLFSGWTAQLDQAAAAIRATLDGLYELPLGGT
ncbi:MAG TPA: lyase family protein, partial [Stellaceae bacterium]|nr:lyase family protein [Stellaceae bacterium]